MSTFFCTSFMPVRMALAIPCPRAREAEAKPARRLRPGFRAILRAAGYAF